MNLRLFDPAYTYPSLDSHDFHVVFIAPISHNLHLKTCNNRVKCTYGNLFQKLLDKYDATNCHLRFEIIIRCAPLSSGLPRDRACVAIYKTASFRAAATARRMSLPAARKKQDKKSGETSTGRRVRRATERRCWRRHRSCNNRKVSCSGRRQASEHHLASYIRNRLS